VPTQNAHYVSTARLPQGKLRQNHQETRRNAKQAQELVCQTTKTTLRPARNDKPAHQRRFGQSNQSTPAFFNNDAISDALSQRN
jgi:hypothetical protein